AGAALPADGLARRERLRPVRLAFRSTQKHNLRSPLPGVRSCARSGWAGLEAHRPLLQSGGSAGAAQAGTTGGARRERARFAQVLDEAADLLERHRELPDAVRWLRKEARAWRP